MPDDNKALVAALCHNQYLAQPCLSVPAASTVSPPRTVGLISSYASGEGCSLKLNGEQFSVNYKYYLKVFGLRFKMTAARDEETICVSHVLSLSKCQFDIIAN